MYNFGVDWYMFFLVMNDVMLVENGGYGVECW